MILSQSWWEKDGQYRETHLVRVGRGVHQKFDYLKTVDTEYTVTWNQRPTRMVESELEETFLATFVVFIICTRIGGNMNMNIKTHWLGQQNTQQRNHSWQDHNGKIMIGLVSVPKRHRTQESQLVCGITGAHCKTPFTEETHQPHTQVGGTLVGVQVGTPTGPQQASRGTNKTTRLRFTALRFGKPRW